MRRNEKWNFLLDERMDEILPPSLLKYSQRFPMSLEQTWSSISKIEIREFFLKDIFKNKMLSPQQTKDKTRTTLTKTEIRALDKTLSKLKEEGIIKTYSIEPEEYYENDITYAIYVTSDEPMYDTIKKVADIIKEKHPKLTKKVLIFPI